MVRSYLKFGVCLIILADPPRSSFGAFEDRPLEVVVQDTAGAAITKAHVRLFSIERVVEADTDAQGRVQFGDIAGGSYDVQVEARGFEKESNRNVQVQGAARDSLRIVLKVGMGTCGFPNLVTYQGGNSGSARVWGRVVDADSRAGVVGATITLHLASPNSQTERSTISDRNGRFQFADLAGARYSVAADRKHYQSASPEEFLLPRQNAIFLELPLDRTGHIHICQ